MIVTNGNSKFSAISPPAKRNRPFPAHNPQAISSAWLTESTHFIRDGFDEYGSAFVYLFNTRAETFQL